VRRVAEDITAHFASNGDIGKNVVANKFQTGFDQPLLAGMFLDKPVMDRNAVQTVSRLNRAHYGKRDVVVVDFTTNASQILKAFAEYVGPQLNQLKLQPCVFWPRQHRALVSASLLL
jgi:type I site-specific restriction-modification system R (restriction) subunit